MPDNRAVKRNVGVSNSSKPSVDNFEEAIRKLKIQTSEKEEGGGGADTSTYPARPGKPDCEYYMRTGMCGYGADCRYNHPTNLSSLQNGQHGGELPQRVGQPDCEYFLKTGMCKYGSTCKYHHRQDRHGAEPVVLNTLGFPMRQEEKPCPYYMRNRACKFGKGCKFHHPQLDSAVSVNGQFSFGFPTSSVISTAAGIPAWPLPESTYMSAPPHSSAPQTYMPVIYPPSQGMVPIDTYMCNFSPAPFTNVYGHSGFSGQITPSPSEVSHLPERPDKPECRYFMNTGSCKYGSDCKYNHPREKIAQLAASSLGPLGLPMRPGQSICSYYTMYGICKFGPTCKYDHPFWGYSYNYGLNLPVVSTHSTTFSYQQSSPATHSLETSPVKSSKFPDWTTKPEAITNKKSNAKTSEDSPKQPKSPAAPEEVLEGHSD